MQATETRDRSQVQRSLRVLHVYQRQLQRLASKAPDEEAFLQAGLKLLKATLGAPAAAFWRPDDRGQWRPGTGSDRRLIAASHLRQHQSVLQQVATEGRARVVMPEQNLGAGSAGSGPISGDAAMLIREPLLLAPVRCAGAVAYLVGAFARAGLDRSSYTAQRMFVAALAHKAGEVAQQAMLRDASRGFDHFRQFVTRLYAQIELQETAYVLANEGRRLLGCGRLSLVVRYGELWRVEAISGQATFDRRSDSVRALQTLAAALGSLDTPYWYQPTSGGQAQHAETTAPESPGGIADAPSPQAQTSSNGQAPNAAVGTETTSGAPVSTAHAQHAAALFCQRTGSRAVVVAPLIVPPTMAEHAATQGEGHEQATGHVVGMLVAEQFTSERFPADSDQRLEVVRLHGAPAVKNAVEHDTAARLSLSRWWGPRRGGPRWRGLAVAAGIALAVLLPLVVIPADFALEGQGVIEPVVRRDVFALGPGVVQEVLVDHGQVVSAGQLLARVRNVDLEVERERLQGSASAAAERLAAVRNSLLESDKMPEADRARLAGEEAQLKQRLESLRLQLDLIRVRMKELEVRSPIDGKVITWDVRNLLTNRPVQPGHLLLTVARTDSDWELLVRMPEHRMGHVLEAHREASAPLEVTFMLASEPGRTYEGQLTEVHGRAEQDAERGSFVPLKVQFDKSRVLQLRPGSEATVKVHCGRRCLGFVWFHDVWEFLQTQVFF